MQIYTKSGNYFDFRVYYSKLSVRIDKIDIFC